MSTDLEFRQQLPRIQLQSVKIQSNSQFTDLDTNGGNNAVAIVGGGESGVVIHQEEGSSSIDNDHQQIECRTPTSDEHKIPTIFLCPPAPRKTRRHRSISCKRKLLSDQLQFFEIDHREEVDDFFRSGFEMAAGFRSLRRRLQEEVSL